jgi:hypothetical protein
MVTIHQLADHKVHKGQKYSTLNLCTLFYLGRFVVKTNFETTSLINFRKEIGIHKIGGRHKRLLYCTN